MNKEQSSFDKEAFQRSWEFYSKIYGPILEPAFKDDSHARVKIISALNRMYGKDLNKAIEHLEDIRECCCYDADWAAWSFFVGLCFDMARDTEHMLHCYNACVSYEPKFYLPYLKLAVQEHRNADFDAAAEHYMTALEYLGEMEASQRVNDGVELAYSSLISCLTMMHRYREAEALLKQAGVGSASFAAVGAMLYAAMGNKQKAEVQLARLEIQDAEQAAQSREMVQDILNGKHPHFHSLPVDGEKIAEFWKWFGSNEANIDTENIGQQLWEVFDFLEREAAVQIEERKIVFKDSYAMSLQLGYGKLIAACPDSLKENWSFSIEH